MKILILGGTRFLGRAIVDDALTAGLDVTLLNRGRTNPGLYPDLENIVGDRDDDLRHLRGRTFDAVIDTSGYFPRQVRTVIDVLQGSIGHYTFVSSVDVYADHSIPGTDETAVLTGVTDPSDEEISDNYGGFKALCEAALDEALPGRRHGPLHLLGTTHSSRRDRSRPRATRPTGSVHRRSRSRPLDTSRRRTTRHRPDERNLQSGVHDDRVGPQCHQHMYRQGS